MTLVSLGETDAGQIHSKVSSETCSVAHFVKLAQAQQIEAVHMVLPEELEVDQGRTYHKRLLALPAVLGWVETYQAQP